MLWVRLPQSHRVISSFRSQKRICKLRLRLLMVLVPASDCLKHKFGANCLNGRNLNVRTVEVQLDSAADIKLLGIKIDNCFKTTASNIGKRLGLLKRTDKFLLLKVENFVLQLTYPAKTWLRWLLFRGHEANKPHVQYVINFQKRCARVILDKKWDTPSGPLFRDLNVMPWFDKRQERAYSTIQCLLLGD